MNTPLANCRIHLPGNAECPQFALYVIEWAQHEPRAPGVTPRTLSRMVCVNHLGHGVDDALSASARGATVQVRIATASDHAGIED